MGATLSYHKGRIGCAPPHHKRRHEQIAHRSLITRKGIRDGHDTSPFQKGRQESGAKRKPDNVLRSRFAFRRAEQQGYIRSEITCFISSEKEIVLSRFSSIGPG